jgi:hypothetical protein
MSGTTAGDGQQQCKGLAGANKSTEAALLNAEEIPPLRDVSRLPTRPPPNQCTTLGPRQQSRVHTTSYFQEQKAPGRPKKFRTMLFTGATLPTPGAPRSRGWPPPTRTWRTAWAARWHSVRPCSVQEGGGTWEWGALRVYFGARAQRQGGAVLPHWQQMGGLQAPCHRKGDLPRPGCQHGGCNRCHAA